MCRTGSFWRRLGDLVGLTHFIVGNKNYAVLAFAILHTNRHKAIDAEKIITYDTRLSFSSLIITSKYPITYSWLMQADYNQKRLRIPPAKRELWSKQQSFIRNKIIANDSFPWDITELQLVAAVDVSFSGRYENGACAGLVIYSVKAGKVIYEDYLYVKLTEEYVPGFLAFRELPPTLELFKRLKANKPHLWPQVVLVDGNGILHKNQCGYACHLGVLMDLPTIGCAKSFFDLDGLHQNEVQEYLRGKLRVQGESIGLFGKSGKQWCKAMLVDQNQEKHLFISIGHRVSLSTATQIVLKLTHRDGPEPIIVADRNSRKRIKRMGEGDYKDAKSYQMIYLLK